MSEPTRVLRWGSGGGGAELHREWLLSNGLGGYASGTLAGVPTRRYHGLLIAALPAPFGRTMVFNHLTEHVRFADGRVVQLGGEERHPDEAYGGEPHLVQFSLEHGLPSWRFDVDGLVIEKTVVLPYMQNTVHVCYRLLDGPPVRLELRPSLHFRMHDAAVSAPIESGYELRIQGARVEVDNGGGELPPLRLHLTGARGELRLDGGSAREVFYRVEADRGYPARGVLWSPGRFGAELASAGDVALTASTEEWPTVLSLEPAQAHQAERERRARLIEVADPAAREGLAAELVLAADQFVISPAGRVEDSARTRAAGRDVRTVIAGYHWFTDWGRDTMISLEGLTLTTGRQAEASWILHTFAHYVRDGLIPNMFPEGERDGLYHTADATLWFFHAIDRYTAVTGDEGVARSLLDSLVAIIEHHLHGTRFGIAVDPEDGLLRQGAEGYQLTWMDAKVEDWVVTPRRGKAVEINALWYNALRLLESWLAAADRAEEAERIAGHAARARTSFNARFWYEQGGYLYDVVDGERGDEACFRPNQVFALSLRHPVLAEERWAAVVAAVRERLLTPVGLRSLAPGERDYKSKYFGDLRARDAAYHQGTVWGWLIGPFVDAWLKVHPEDRAGARELLHGFDRHLSEACVGSISEVFDAEAPFTPRGCIAQAWSVAEVLRCWAKTAP